MEKTLILIKPDAVERNLIGRIISLYEENGLKVTALKMIHADLSLAERHYEEHKGRAYYERLMTYITRSPLVALVAEGEDAIKRVRKINGSTNPADAAEGTVRKLYGIDNSLNSVHSSDSTESAEREISIWFTA